MKIAVFSDLHLKSQSEDTAKYNAFLGELKKLSNEQIDTLYLLGDIIDVFIGNFSFWHHEHAPLWNSLKLLADSGVNIVWLEGNHDFHFKKVAEKYSITVLDEVHLAEFANQSILMAHGDLVDEQDLAYLRWRKITRSFFFRKAVDCIPSPTTNFFYQLSKKISSQSRKQHVNTNVEKYKELFRNYVHQCFSENPQLKAIFLGHSHVEDYLNLQNKHYINLGYWSKNKGLYCVWELSNDAKPELRPVLY